MRISEWSMRLIVARRTRCSQALGRVGTACQNQVSGGSGGQVEVSRMSGYPASVANGKRNRNPLGRTEVTVSGTIGETAVNSRRPDSPRPARAKPLLSFSSYIGGKDVEGVGWVYTVSARSLLEDVFTSVSLKRALEQDPDPRSAAAQHPYVVGRCAVVGDDQIDAATEAAAGAVRGWARLPAGRAAAARRPVPRAAARPPGRVPGDPGCRSAPDHAGALGADLPAAGRYSPGSISWYASRCTPSTGTASGG